MGAGTGGHLRPAAEPGRRYKNGSPEHRDRQLAVNGNPGTIRRHGLGLMHESTLRSSLDPVCALNDRSLVWQVARRRNAGTNAKESKSCFLAPFGKRTCLETLHWNPSLAATPRMRIANG